jgi:Kef-type K+ transport system membrane component KefB
MHGVFTELSLIIVITAGVSLVMKLLRQPLILGYILAGLLVGPSALGLIHSGDMFEAFSTIGIALLLFIIGLGMNIRELKQLGKVVMLIAAGILTILGSIGFATSSLLGFTTTEGLIIGLALFFSSTIIIVKILSDKKEQNRLHGQIAIGVILVDDIVATFALLFVAASKDGGLDPAHIGILVLKGLALLGVLALCSTKLLPKISRFMASNQELLFLFAISWGFGIASLFEIVGFSIEVGSLFAGVALATSPYAQEISARLKPLRDFFIVLFFIVLGESMSLSNISTSLGYALIFSLMVMIIKPVVIMIIMGILGYTKRVSFKTGINLSQISEFSIILVVLAHTSGLVSDQISVMITLVAIITIAISTYLMLYDNELYVHFEKLKLPLFNRAAIYKEKLHNKNYALVLFGYHQGGHEFIKAFRKINKPFLVIDYDPAVIDHLDRMNVPRIYGDATDIELLDELGLQHAELVISTLSDFDASQQLIRSVSRINSDAIIIAHADNREEALKLYDSGCTYVMIPNHVGSQKLSSFIVDTGLSKKDFQNFREEHVVRLSEHPS